MVCTNGGSGGISQYAIYSKNECTDGITTLAAGECVSVSASGIDSNSTPCVWQLVGTDSGSGGVSEYAVYSQDEIYDRVTAFAAGERISICAGGVNGIAIPVIW